MQEQFDRENGLDNKLSKLKPSQLDQLYLRLFNTADGLLVLRDLANRCFVDTTTVTNQIEGGPVMNEGMRSVYLSIVTRMKDASNKGGK